MISVSNDISIIHVQVYTGMYRFHEMWSPNKQI